MARDCPLCGLVNTDSALRCDCGYDFPTARLEPSYLASRRAVVAGGIGLGVAGGAWLLFKLLRLGAMVTRQPREKR